ncbi:MAG: ATP-binding protein [Paracoccaceae bacterium]|nr:ATP-binding protein [Paracoccaceae bacterium]
MSATEHAPARSSLVLQLPVVAFLLLALGAVCAVGWYVSASATIGLSFLAAASGFAAIALVAGVSHVVRTWRRGQRLKLAEFLIENDPGLCFICSPEGQVLRANKAARDQFADAMGDTLAHLLRNEFASSEGLLFRLLTRAQRDGTALEDVTSHADRYRIFVRLVEPGLVIWRMDSRVDTSPNAPGQQPLMTLGRNGAILFMNGEARKLIGQRAKRLDDIISDLPLRPGGVHRLAGTLAPQQVLVQVNDSGAGRQEITLSPLADPELEASVSGGFDNLPVPLLRLAADGTVLRANPEARKLLDMGSESQGNLVDYMEGLGRAIRDWLEEAADGRMLHHSEFLRLTRSDREMFVQVTLSRVVEDGQATLVAVLNDATELKSLEAQFVQSQKMQAIGQLAGGVAHDFNNLLTAISGHCDLMLLRHDQGDPDYGDLVQINQNANRAAALVGQLLAFSRKQTMRPEVLDLRDTLSDLTHLLNRLVGEKVRLSLQHDPVLPPIRGDRRQLEQVMMNLVVNARDAMPEGGEIIIETERRVLKEPLTRDRAMVPPGTYVTVSVSDEGIGIPKSKLQKVFEPFFTTKRTGEGTGLGLSTVYGIVKQTGGFIFVDSVPGNGTCFTLMFPAHEARVEAAQVAEKAQPRQLPEKGSGVVLLVEDEAPVRAFAARALRLRGYTVVEAETAEEALAILEDKDLKVDVFVTDVVMPGMDGPTWVRKALEERPDVRVIFVSGYTEDAFGNGRGAIPNSEFLPKPFSLTDLTETVHRQFD